MSHSRRASEGSDRDDRTGVAGMSAGRVFRSRVRLSGVMCACVGGLGILGFAAASAFAAGAPVVEEQWSAKVSASGATLAAKVNPEGSATTYRFEYATSEAALLAGEGTVLPAPPAAELDAGSGEEGVGVEVHVQGLSPRTDYWYRLAAVSGEGRALGCDVVGSCVSLTTQPAIAEEEVLPDGRKWELVSPPIKDGALIRAMGERGPVIQAAEDGGAITYAAEGSAKSGSEAPAGNGLGSQILSTRGGEDGWSSRDIATPHSVSTGLGYEGLEYRFFSTDLSLALVEPYGGGETGKSTEGVAPLSEGASELTLYLRADAPLSPGLAEQGDYGEAVTEGGYKPLVTSKPGYANVAEGVGFGSKLYFDGASANLSHVIVATQVMLPLIAGEEGGDIQRLYEWSAGRLEVVNVLPEAPPWDGKEANEAVLGYTVATGRPSKNVSGAISNDGSRVFWSVKGHLFMRDMTSRQTVQLDLPAGAVSSLATGSARFEFASSDGSRAFFTDEERLTADSMAESGKPEFYVCEIVEEADGHPKCELTDLTPGAAGVSAGVQGVTVPASDEGSYVYFVANGVLSKEANGEGQMATPGNCGSHSGAEEDCNLYVRHYNEETEQWEAPVFIVTLSSEDAVDWVPGLSLQNMTARVSPDGEYLTFMSERSLTGYDNRDVNSGVPDQEVYLYSAPSAGAPSGRLVCVSCNPTGERPNGVFVSPEANSGEGLLVDKIGILREKWIAAIVPGWTAITNDVARYQSRYLSDDGRVFFDSSDALVPQATNGLMNVFEYEPAGVGGCTASSATFSERSGGCVALISSGSSNEESAFLDASESGEDVFFLTSQSLVAEDKDTAFDVYDAHVCSAAVPCSVEAVSPAPCETADSCRAAPASQPSVFGAPSSATFSGRGNPGTSPPPVVVVTSKSKLVKCKRGFVEKHGRCVRKQKRKRKAKSAKRVGDHRGARS